MTSNCCGKGGYKVKQKRPIREKQITGKVPTWEQVFDAIPDSVALISPSFELLKANKAMRKFLDIPFGKELKGKCRDLMKKICRSKVCPVKALRKKKKTVHFRDRNRRALLPRKY